MNKVLVFLFTLSIATACFNKSTSRPNTMSNSGNGSFYDFKMKSIDGEVIDFSQYKGKKVMLVNVASKCGYTPQYADLQMLHEKHGDKIVILGFPANNFGAQEPGTNDEIASFCEKNYGVEFQMFEKISVKGDDMHPIYQFYSLHFQLVLIYNPLMLLYFLEILFLLMAYYHQSYYFHYYL